MAISPSAVAFCLSRPLQWQVHCHVFARGGFAIVVGFLHGFYVVKQLHVRICFKITPFAELVCKRSPIRAICHYCKIKIKNQAVSKSKRQNPF